MALTRVQATPVPASGSGASIARTFSTPPTLGNAIIVAYVKNNTEGPASSVTDNKGNTYSLAQMYDTGGQHLFVYYCPAITATGASFTVTVTLPTSRFWMVAMVEVGGVGPGLVVDRTVTNGGAAATTTPTTGATAALLGTEAFLVALYQIALAPISIAVNAASPSWTQEAEALTSTGNAANGEIDTRIVTGATGTTPSCGWTTGASGAYSAMLVAFSTGGAVVATAQPFVILPV
jgi:hypothetical protein